MWKFKWISFPSSVLFVVLLHLHMCREGYARNHFLMNADENIANTNSRNLDYQAEYHECYITVQETRRIGGQCVKIKDNFQGCVAGSLMDPFHQDCL